MSKEFYNYLAEITIEFFGSYAVKSGEKFILRLDSREDVENFYYAVNNYLNVHNKAITYRREDDDIFETVSFMTGTDNLVQLIIIPEINITNAYITRIRNTVKNNEAIFIVCYNPIDSIAGGTESLQKEGMPFHKNSFCNWIKDKINTSKMIDSEKQVLLFDLENKQNSDDMNMYSINDYANILTVLHNGQIENDNFRDFGLFEDIELNTLTLSNTNEESEISKRISENYDLFKKINNSVKYGNLEDDLENTFTESYIEKIKKNIKINGLDGWDKGITYVETETAKKKKLKQEKQKLTSTEIFADGTALVQNKDFFVRSNKETDAGRRKRNILIFNVNSCEKILMSIGVSDFLGSKPELTPEKNSSVSVSVSGKKINIEVEHKDITISRVKIKSTESFEINFCIINCESTWFEDITSCYLISGAKSTKKQKALVINCENEELTFNHNGSETVYAHLEPDMIITADYNEKLILSIDDNSFNDNEANGKILVGSMELPVVFKAETAINTSITGIKIVQQKLANRHGFKYLGNNKLIFETNEYNANEAFRENLETEEYIVKNGCLCCTVSDNTFISEPVNVSDSLRSAYEAFISYFKSNDTLPSIAYYDDMLKELAIKYLESVSEELGKILNGKSLTNEQSEIFKVGTINYPSGEQIVYSSLHPINVAYQLMLTNEGSGCEIREDILKKLTSDNLVPYIHDINGRLYKVQEQIHTPFWTYYCPEDRTKYKGTGKFVADLVCEKIRDFYEHFTYLFDGMGGNRLIINAVNMGDCRNLFKGIINYYKAQIGKNPSDALAIDINVYNKERDYNIFEVLSRKSALKAILAEMGIKEENKDYSESEFINLIMTKVNYYRKNIDSSKYDYCHLAFIEMDNDSEIGFSNKNDIRSGTMLNGLLSGVTSMYYGVNQSYRTGYGSQFNLPEGKDNFLLNLAEYYNSAMIVYGKSDPYNDQNAICTYIDDKETDIINRTYDSSNWVVFVEPKVDLNFFKNDKNDVMIIHYSDQHTTSSGYNAITVTRKTEQYENILREYLEKGSGIASDRSHIRSIIDMFNAINGDWMLKLISSKGNFSKEKISVQSAVKLALAFYKSDNIIWIPISLEEILRVSGSVGYAKNDGLFSAKNLGYINGATSDDLLLFGVEVSGGEVFVHLYPLEVKIGYKNNNETDNAIAQIKRTREILDKNLIDADGDNIQTKVYRNFFAQLAVISAEKLNLYKVWTGQDWERIVNTDVRGKLLNDDFTITDSMEDKIGDGVIISFKDGTIMRDVYTSSGVTVIKFLYNDGINYIVKSVDDIYSDIQKVEAVTEFRNNMNRVDCVPNVTAVISAPDKTYEGDLDLPEISPLLSFDKYEIKELADKVSNDIYNEEVTNTEPDFSLDTEENNFAKSPDGMRILFGNDANDGSPLYWYPNNTEKIMHPNTGIIGTMGTGKTQFTKSLILQLVRERHNNPGDSPLGILIFDYKGDYNKSKTDFIEATNAKVYDLFHLPFNPFSMTVTENSKPMLPLHTANGFKDTLSKCYLLGVKQETTLRDCIMQAYELKGINKADKSTWNKIPPTFDTVFKVYMDREGAREDSLYAALSELQGYEIFEPNAENTVPLYDLINGVTVINLSGYARSIQNLVVAITLDLFYSQMQVNGHSQINGNLRQLTKFILVDEADNFLKEGFPSLRKILKEGREFGVGTILSTQFLKHFDTTDDDFAKYIFTWIVHNVADLSMKDVKNLFNTTNKSQEEDLFSGIKKLTKHHSFVKFGDSSSPYYIKDKAFWELIEEEKKGE
ncbi:MAG: DNA phosphorothioation-dependent restriction protein DptH [Ruminococcus flavefaciens]|nr:DNA phosphorothioation-dependent restriction protein DptH [Ruminococcus flavefaciens]